MFFFGWVCLFAFFACSLVRLFACLLACLLVCLFVCCLLVYFAVDVCCKPFGAEPVFAFEINFANKVNALNLFPQQQNFAIKPFPPTAELCYGVFSPD